MGVWIAAAVLCAAQIMPASAGRIDTRLADALALRPTETVPVWVEFADKGERNADELDGLLARAEAALTPRARARRERAGLDPLVDYRDVPLNANYVAALEDLGYPVYGASRWFNRVAVRLDAAGARSVAALPFVRLLTSVETARRMDRLPVDESTLTTAPQPQLGVSAALIDYGVTATQVSQIGIPALHDSGYVGTGVLIAVLDSGFDGYAVHQALAGIDVPAGHERDFVDGDITIGGHNHGTFVLGCIAGNLPGTYVGAAFNATFALARTEDVSSETRQEMVYWQMAAEWADSLGTDLLTSSVGYFLFDDPAEDYTPDSLDGHTTIIAQAAQIAASKGILLVNSAGNYGSGPPEWNGKIVSPADVHGDSLLAAGAVSAGGTRASFSSKGPTADGRIKPDLMALGVSDWVVSSGNPSGYLQVSGTSFSAPLLAGLAACVMQARPFWSAAEVIQALRASGDRFQNPDTLYGYGIPNGMLALQWPSTVSVIPPLGAPQLALVGPNPMRSDGPDTRVRFALHRDAPASAHGEVRIYDAQGRIVRHLWSGELARGRWVTVAWDGRDEAGKRQAGMFFVTLDAAGRRQSVRIVSLP